MDAEIIAVGSELLTPERMDTNSLFLTKKLNALGIEVRYKTIVGDEPERLADVLRGAMNRSQLVIVTGGLLLLETLIVSQSVLVLIDYYYII